MCRPIILVLCAAWTSGAADAQGPAASFFSERSYDFGMVPRGAKRVHAFTVTNTTSEPLRILSIRIPCNCVSATVTKKELAPGEATTIVAQLDTRRFAGAMTKYCYVLFDQPREEVQLVVHAFSHEGLFFEPETFAFGKIKKGASAEKSVTISISDESARGAWQVTAESGFVQATVDNSVPSQGSGTVRLTARLRPDLPVGDWYTTIALTSSAHRLGPIQIPLTVTVEP